MLINMLAKAAVCHLNCSPQLGPGCETWRFFRALSESKKHHKNQGLAESLLQWGSLDWAQNAPFLKITLHRLAKPSSVSLPDLAAWKCINAHPALNFRSSRTQQEKFPLYYHTNVIYSALRCWTKTSRLFLGLGFVFIPALQWFS